MAVLQAYVRLLGLLTAKKSSNNGAPFEFLSVHRVGATLWNTVRRRSLYLSAICSLPSEALSSLVVFKVDNWSESSVALSASAGRFSGQNQQ